MHKCAIQLLLRVKILQVNSVEDGQAIKADEPSPWVGYVVNKRLIAMNACTRRHS